MENFKNTPEFGAGKREDQIEEVRKNIRGVENLIIEAEEKLKADREELELLLADGQEEEEEGSAFTEYINQIKGDIEFCEGILGEYQKIKESLEGSLAGFIRIDKNEKQVLETFESNTIH